MTTFDVVGLMGATSGFMMVLGGMWLIAKGQLTLAGTPQVDALSLEWKKQFRLTTQAPGLAFFIVGLIFLIVALVFLKPAAIVPLEFEGEISGVEEPVSILIRPVSNWELAGSTSGKVQGKIYPDLSLLLLVITAPGYEPYSKTIEINGDSRRLGKLGRLELRRSLRKSDISPSVANMPFNTPPIAATTSSSFGVPQ